VRERKVEHKHFLLVRVEFCFFYESCRGVRAHALRCVCVCVCVCVCKCEHERVRVLVCVRVCIHIC